MTAILRRFLLWKVSTSRLVPQHKPSCNELPSLKTPLPSKASVKRSKNFRALFCEKFQCSPQEFEGQLFSRCLHRRARPLAAVVSKLDPDFFREDLGFIGDLASARSHDEVRMEVDRFRGRNLRDTNWLRKRFSLRISGKRVQRLSRKLFSGK